jgi:hypothetical protein
VGTVTITTTLSSASGLDVMVSFTVGGTAMGGGVEHDLADGTITIPAGAQTASVTFNVVDDALNEEDKTVVVTLGTPTNATLGTISTQTITIHDDDAAPVLMMSQTSVTVDENVGTLTLSVTLSSASSLPITVNYATGGGTAVAGINYTASSGTLTFTPGTTSQTISIPILSTSEDEYSSTFLVSLSAPTNASIGAGVTTVTITDQMLYHLIFPVFGV